MLESSAACTDLLIEEAVENSNEKPLEERQFELLMFKDLCASLKGFSSEESLNVTPQRERKRENKIIKTATSLKLSWENMRLDFKFQFIFQGEGCEQRKQVQMKG